MTVLNEKYVMNIYLIALILMQVINFNTVAGLSCIQCGGTVAACSENLSETATACPAGGDFKKCFTQIDDNGNIVRGCRNSTEESTCKENCVLTDEGKNNQLICKSCGGTDENCSQTDAMDKKYSKICDAGISKCIKKVSNKLIVRGCAVQNDVAQCTDKNNCELCDKNNCNTGIFPANRLSCYQCADDKCNDVSGNKIISKPCLYYEEKDECYTKGESENSMIRGCKSDTNENKCSTVAAGCAFCNATSCNDLKYKRPPTLKCYQCTGNSTDSSCFKNQNGTTLKSCAQEITYNELEYCYTQYESETIQRGCLHDTTTIAADKCNDTMGGACSKCTGDGCNVESVEFTCIVCRSDVKETCWNNADKFQGQACRTGISSPKQGCFHGIWHGVAIRGCTIDASPQTQALCENKNNNNKCEICYQKDCNVKRSSGTKTNLSYVLMSILLIALWKFK